MESWDTEAPDQRKPVSVLTGFLGSGKTTLLNHLVKQPEMKGTLVIVNEFGEIGIDHLLVEEVSDEMVLINSGCLCCTVRNDLMETLMKQSIAAEQGTIPPFHRVVIETTGLADPAPILHTLMADPYVGGRYRMDGVITTVDAVNGERTLDAQFESVKQAAVADRIVLTKADLVDAEALGTLRNRLLQLEPGRAGVCREARRDRPLAAVRCRLVRPEEQDRRRGEMAPGRGNCRARGGGKPRP